MAFRLLLLANCAVFAFLGFLAHDWISPPERTTPVWRATYCAWTGYRPLERLHDDEWIAAIPHRWLPIVRPEPRA